MSVKERRERERRQRRETIMNSAIELLRTEGLSGLSMDRIAEKAELSKGTLYLYFRNKEHLIREIFWSRLNLLIEKIGQKMSQEGEFEDIVKDVIRIVIEFHTENVDIFKTLYHSLPSGAYDFLREVKNIEKDYKEKIQRMSQSFFGRFDRGQFRVEPKYLQTTLRGIIWGFLTEKIFGYSDIELDPELIYTIFARGVLK